MQIRFPETTFANRIIIVAGSYITLFGLLWFLVAEFRRIVAQAHAYAEQLAHANHALAREINERKQAQDALAEKHALLQMLIDSTPDHIYVKDLAHRFLIANQATIRELGATSLADVEGKTDYDFHATERTHQFFEEERVVMTSGRILINREDFLIEHGSGQKRWYLTTKAPLRDAHGQIIGLVGFNRDITERKRAEEEIRAFNATLEQRVQQRTAELEAANKELQSFAYVVSHDLKVPLRNMTQLITWLMNDYADTFDAQGKEYLDLLLKRAQQMNNLIQAILQYSRVGRIKADEPVDLSTLLHEVCETLNPPPTIQINLSSDFPVLTGDRIRIQQVFQNLIGNAIKFLEKPEGTISIDCADHGAYWQFSVTDNGPGIDPQHHETIFQLFQTLHQHDKTESTGIGLAIVKKIIESRGGKIWVESAVGQGCRFCFTVPKSGEQP
ncbi:multi-sensor signal transduction histidine kinase [Candidatus Moduliflexus flocculans]|uniref:histidine kinase n=1 Tax=Candidatus Moduliflexus flocculans TaxID=1499966 RepID=A0A0S6VTH9_9BACT|nr:multi-sensor signal transduction histidine kinase [Candidatus Moduliflexus flocculans]